MTIKPLDFTNIDLANRALIIQKRAYQIEAELIGFDGIPHLHHTLDDLRNSDEHFIGYFVEEVLAGVLSYSIQHQVLDIGRLVVHPDYFRQGIGRKLVNFVLNMPDITRWEVSTGAGNHPARTLYEHLGFQFIGDRRLPIGITLALYEKYNASD